MKKLLGFMFGYGARGNGVLGWNTRLGQQDHLYHQGRNFLSMLIYGPLALVLVVLPTSIIGGMLHSTFPNGTIFAMAVGIYIIMLLPLFYLSFAAIKLTILRLHDFNLSGWWILYSLILGLADYCFDSIFPGFTFFLSMQSLVYLGLLIWPAPSAAPNAYGEAAINSTDTKPRWVRIVPLVLWVFSWLAGMLTPLVASQVERAAAQTTQVTGEARLQQQQIEQLLNANNVTTQPVTPVSPTISN